MASGFLPHSLSIRDTSTTNGGQGFAGINLGTINYASNQSNPGSTEQAAIKCRQDLFLTDPDEDREKVTSAKGKRVAGTCEWITHDAKYQAWLSDDNKGDGNDSDNTRLLWILGGPGKGKTMMSVFLTEELKRHSDLKDNAKLVFLFCSAKDKKRNIAVAVLRGLVH